MLENFQVKILKLVAYLLHSKVMRIRFLELIATSRVESKGTHFNIILPLLKIMKTKGPLPTWPRSPLESLVLCEIRTLFPSSPLAAKPLQFTLCLWSSLFEP